MFVRTRSWSDKTERYYDGKIHWMTHPWVTKCGKEMDEEWVLDEPFGRNWYSGCKRCGLGRDESS